jgi:excinuclease UvrABC nuclease subunit
MFIHLLTYCLCNNIIIQALKETPQALETISFIRNTRTNQKYCQFIQEWRPSFQICFYKKDKKQYILSLTTSTPLWDQLP